MAAATHPRLSTCADVIEVFAAIKGTYGAKLAEVVQRESQNGPEVANAVMRVMASVGEVKSPVRDNTPGANGMSKDGSRPITCWTCKSKDHTRQNCTHPNATKKRERDGRGRQGDGRGNQKRERFVKVCDFFLDPNKSCRFGDRCSFEHPAGCAGNQQAAAVMGQPHGHFQQGAPPPPQFAPPPQQHQQPPPQMQRPPPDFTTTDGAFHAQGEPAQQRQRCTGSYWNGTGWTYTYAMVTALMLCFATCAGAAAPVRAEGFHNMVNVEHSEQFVLPNANTGTRITSGYWDNYQHGDHWAWARERNIAASTLNNANSLYVGQTQTVNHTRGCHHSNSPTETSAQSSEFLWDSGANINVTNQRSRLVNYRGTKTIKGVMDASGKAHQVVGFGECWMEVECTNGKRIFRIERILHVPTFALSIVSESWARSAGFGYTAPPLWFGKCKVSAYDSDGKIHNSFKLISRQGLNFISGNITTELTMPMLNRYETTETTINRQEYRKKHCNLATAPTFREFEKRVADTEDEQVLSNMLDGQDDEGFDEAIPKLTKPMRVRVQIRLAELGTLTVDNPAYSPFFKLHHKLGHGPMVETARLAKHLGLKMPRMEERFCEYCIRASLQRRAKVKATHDRSHLRPFEKIFTDIQGPFPVRSLYNGFKYVIGFIDAKTHEGKIYGMHSLEDVTDCTVAYLTYVRTQKIMLNAKYVVQVEATRNGTFDPVSYTTLQGDSHSVYRGAEFRRKIHSKFNVKLQHSAPYEQHQNGMIERWWKTLGCRARALMFAQRLPNGYWYWAYQHAARCHQIIGTSANEGDISPYEMKTGEKPLEKLKQLRAFGAECYVWIPNPGKLGEHGRKGVLVGWDDGNQCHIVYFPATKGHPASIRTSQHIAIKDHKLPDAVLKGEVGMVYPGVEPFSPDDDLEVDLEVVRQSMEENGGVTTHTPCMVPTFEKNGGVIIRNEPDSDSTNITQPAEASTSKVRSEVPVEDDGAFSDADDMLMTEPEQPPGDTMHTATESENVQTQIVNDDVSIFADDTPISNVQDVQVIEQIPVPRAEPEQTRSHSPVLPPDGDRVLKQHRRLPRRKSAPKRFDEIDFDGNTKSNLMSDPMEEELFISTAQAERLIVNSCIVDSRTTKTNSKTKSEFPIGKIQFDCRKALNSEFKEGFSKSIKSELDSIAEYKVMDEVLYCDIPHGEKLFNSYMLCHRKTLGGGNEVAWKCKSRLIVDGSMAIPGIHTSGTDISTDLPRWGPIRCMVANAKGKGWMIRIGDVKTAFLKGQKSGITIYMRMPIGLRQKRRHPNGSMQEVCQAVHGNLYVSTIIVRAVHE